MRPSGSIGTRGGHDSLWCDGSLASVAAGAVVDVVDEVDVMGAIRQAVASRVEGRGLVLGVDDAHCLDEGSAALVHQLCATDAAFVFLTLRSGEIVSDAITALWKDGLVELVELQPLSPGEVTALLESVLGAAGRRAFSTRAHAAQRWESDVFARGNQGRAIGGPVRARRRQMAVERTRADEHPRCGAGRRPHPRWSKEPTMDSCGCSPLESRCRCQYWRKSCRRRRSRMPSAPNSYRYKPMGNAS